MKKDCLICYCFNKTKDYQVFEECITYSLMELPTEECTNTKRKPSRIENW